MATESFTVRFMSKVDYQSGCWIWTAATTDGYGSFWLRGRQQAAHRVSYELFVGEIPKGLQLDHLCGNRACVNPEHLEPVTAQENIRRRALPMGTDTVNGSKTHCPKGHPYDEANTIRWRNTRTCRACRRVYQNGLRRRRKEMAS